MANYASLGSDSFCHLTYRAQELCNQHTHWKEKAN